MSSPEKIWLQNWTSDPSVETTWCVDKINDDDIEYVLASQVENLQDACKYHANISLQNAVLQSENEKLFDLLRTTYRTLKSRGIDDMAFALSSSIDSVLKEND